MCNEGYEGTNQRPPQDGSNAPMNENARCTEPAAQSNARGAQHAPRAGAAYRAPVVASYDPEAEQARTGGARPPARLTLARYVGTARPFGEESWKWLFLQPAGTTPD